MEETLERRLYTFGDVDRILALPSGTAKRWVNGYTRADRFYDPVVRYSPEPDDALVRWGEFIETYYLARLRQHQRPISLQQIRRAVLRLREQWNRPYVFALEGVLHADRDLLEIVRVIQEEEGIDTLLVERLADGQLSLIPEARSRLERIQYADGIAVRVHPRPDINSISVSGVEDFGRPTIDGTHISASAVAELVQSGDSILRIASGYGVAQSAVFDAGIFVYGDRWRLSAA